MATNPGPLILLASVIALSVGPWPGFGTSATAPEEPARQAEPAGVGAGSTAVEVRIVQQNARIYAELYGAPADGNDSTPF
jgi:hypothetical protein